jgi:hypothetical protein
MNIYLIRSCSTAVVATFLITACSVAKLEARLEANPQCKDVINPKTGALMPCPGTDKSFYREVGLAPAKSTPADTNQATTAPVTISTSSSAQGTPNITSSSTTSPAKTAPVQADCKPQIHKKTGGTLPCPAPD